MEAFTYSVSHDLRAPLRAVDGYARILTEDYSGLLGAEGRRLCGVISASARDMGRLIDSLLSLSRLSRQEMRRIAVDMTALAEAVYRETTAPAEQVRIDFQVASLPPAQGDPALLRQVWVNLLGNAVKFSRRQERARIEVGWEKGAYFVRDNGVGFDMAYAGKLFGVFQRLHSAQEFEGTGAGLAIAQRIVHRHGGRIWGEGEAGKGATFFFTLPD
jgi:two-component system sensor kinase